jgi:hypothetical protein
MKCFPATGSKGQFRIANGASARDEAVGLMVGPFFGFDGIIHQITKNKLSKPDN